MAAAAQSKLPRRWCTRCQHRTADVRSGGCAWWGAGRRPRRLLLQGVREKKGPYEAAAAQCKLPRQWCSRCQHRTAVARSRRCAWRACRRPRRLLLQGVRKRKGPCVAAAARSKLPKWWCSRCQRRTAAAHREVCGGPRNRGFGKLLSCLRCSKGGFEVQQQLRGALILVAVSCSHPPSSAAATAAPRATSGAAAAAAAAAPHTTTSAAAAPAASDPSTTTSAAAAASLAAIANATAVWPAGGGSRGTAARPAAVRACATCTALGFGTWL